MSPVFVFFFIVLFESAHWGPSVLPFIIWIGFWAIAPKKKELASYKAAAPKGNRAMIEKLTELYYNKKIPNYKTVENVVTRLMSKTKNEAIQAKSVR